MPWWTSPTHKGWTWTKSFAKTDKRLTIKKEDMSVRTYPLYIYILVLSYTLLTYTTNVDTFPTVDTTIAKTSRCKVNFFSAITLEHITINTQRRSPEGNHGKTKWGGMQKRKGWNVTKTKRYLNYDCAMFERWLPPSINLALRKFWRKWFFAITPTLQGRRSFTSCSFSFCRFRSVLCRFFTSILQIFVYFLGGQVYNIYFCGVKRYIKL